MDEGSGTTATDARGGDNNGALANGAAWTSAGGGVSGTGVILDGANDQVNLVDSDDINTAAHGLRTVAMWFKADDPTSAAKQVLYQEGGGTRGLAIYLESGLLYVGGWNNGDNGWGSTFLSTELDDTGWHHVALVLDADGATTLQSGAFAGYLDGLEFARGDAAQLNSHTGDIGLGVMRGGGEFHDGDQTGTGLRFDGVLDEFHLWNRALNLGEVGQLYGWGNAAPALDLSSIPASPGSVVIPSGVGVVLSGAVSDPDPTTTTWEELSVPPSGVITFDDAASPATTATFSVGGYYTMRLKSGDGEQTSVLDVNVHVGIDAAANPSTSNQVIYYGLNEGSGSTAGDGVGGDNNGTFAGTPTWTSASGGVSGAAVLFDSADDVIEIANAPGINSSGSYTKKTIALWFQAAGSSPGAREVLYEEGGGTRGLNIYLDGETLYVGGWNNGSNGWDSTYISAPVSRGQWHHVALQLDVLGGSVPTADGLQLWLDGALAGAGEAAQMSSHTGAIGLGAMRASSKLHDGNASGDGLPFNGIIDEFHYFNGRVLSADEIGLLFAHGNLGAFVDAGPDQLAHPGLLASLAGSSSDDGRWSGSLLHSWSASSGPGSPGFSMPDGSGIDTLATFPVAGSYTVQLRADDGQVTTFDSVDIVMTGEPYYDLWMDGYPSVTGPARDFLANPDADPYLNLVEYGVGANPEPGSPFDSTGPISAIVDDTGSSYLEFTYRRRKDALLRGLSYRVEFTPDFSAGSWSSAGATETEVVSLDSDFEEVTVRFDTPLGPEHLRCFGRLVVEIDE